jgi:hypothetical protein
MPTAVSFARQATDEQIRCLSIYTDAEGETHMQEIEFPLLRKQIFPNTLPLHLSQILPSTGCSFCRVPVGMHEVRWHNPPHRKLVIWLTGEVEFETSDGDVRRLAAGSAVFAEDTTGKGHISRHPPEGQLLMFIDLK